MWINRILIDKLKDIVALPIKILKGPRQCGKTSLLLQLKTHHPIFFDDLNVRTFARENPRLFLDSFQGKPLLLDEATLVPEIFLELKRRVDESRREKKSPPDIWITGSNQTLLRRQVQESLAGRASYFDLSTLSLEELGDCTLQDQLLKGGWPQLYVQPSLPTSRYLDDLIVTFIEKDIAAAARVEKIAAFMQTLRLTAGRVGQLFNASDIATNVSVDVTTVQSWLALLEQNGILRRIAPFYTNLNQRLIKAPKYYLEDTAMACRLQGWSQFEPLLLSPAFGSLLENLALSEIVKFFVNRVMQPEIYFVRSKEKVEVDFLIALPNQRYIAAEVKASVHSFTKKQTRLLDSLQINIVERWILYPNAQSGAENRPHAKPFAAIATEIERVLNQ